MNSEYSQIGKIRRDEEYYYEEFIPNDGADIKGYCVGTSFAYADARKCPALTTKIEKKPDGKFIFEKNSYSFTTVIHLHHGDLTSARL